MIYRTRRSSTTTVPSATREVKLVRTLLHVDQLQHCPQSYLMSHKCPACLQVGWNEVPLPVLNLILQDMTAKEMWALRAVGNCWAKAVRSTIEFALTIQATDKNLKAKMSAICRRQMHYPLAQFVLQLRKGNCFQRSAKLLRSVTKLVSRLLLLLFRFPKPCCLQLPRPCLQLKLVGCRMPHVSVCLLQGECLPVVQLILPIHTSEADATSQLLCYKDASAIAIACTWLQDRGVQVYLELSSEAKAKLAPIPTVVKKLAPFLRSVDYHPMRNLSEHFFHPARSSQLCFTDSHVSALASISQSLQTLCISECIPPSSLSFQTQMPFIAAMSNLTKLRLYMHGQPDFSPLAQLNKLKDLALRCSALSSDCSQVIASNRFSLRRLTIESESWSDATYAAVSNVASLKKVVLLVDLLSEANAALVGDLVHPSSVQVYLFACTLTTLRLLYSGRSRYTALHVETYV